MGDSNPRYSYPYVSLANWWFQPLTQSSLCSKNVRKSSKFIVLVETNNKKNEIFIEDTMSTPDLPQMPEDTAKNCAGF